MVPSIHELLTYCRPAGSVTDLEFCERFIAPLPGAYCDTHGNWHVVIGAEPSILFSAHTDTVHRAPGRQTVMESNGIIRLSKRSIREDRNCLGADDTAGIWILLNLIRSGIRGHYVFHYAEEHGGIGSGDLANKYPEWLKRFRMAIAFDRRGTSDVITHQIGGRTASNVFAESMVAAMSTAGLPGYGPMHGVYTDTANYSHLIPECTNLSVGYNYEHSPDECLNRFHLERLRDTLIRLDWGSLIVDRDPTTEDPDDWRGNRWTTIGRDDSPELDDCVQCLSCGTEFLVDWQSGLMICPDCGEDTNLEFVDDDPATSDPDSVYLDDTYARVQAELTAQLLKWKKDR